ncbi:MAG: helix-turn-helix transcriptional regulator, partial [Rhodospirillaceae bacterium]|nr:helix-turn-helix transcriptional regulator [Rhodospirillaceae bacterium]
DLISSIYDLPLQPDGWQAVLDQFAPTINATGSAIMAVDPHYSEHHINVTTSNYAPELSMEYNKLFGADEKVNYAKIAMEPKRGFITDMESLGMESLEEQANLPAVQWLIKNFGVRHRAASCLNLKKIWMDLLVVQFDKDRDSPITDHEKEIGSFFLGHFAKSVELGRAFGVLKSRFDGVLTALNRYHIGIFVLSPNGSVVVKNAEADRILEAGDGLTLSRDARLQPRGDTERSELKQIITRAVSTAQAQDNRAESLMTLPRSSGADPYIVEVAPIRDHGEIETEFNGALVFVIDPAKTDVVSTEGMQMLYQLTGAESEICKLIAEGMETDDMADARNITRETVRSYIKQILHKTGVNNRAQLVRLALNVNLPIDPAAQDE